LFGTNLITTIKKTEKGKRKKDWEQQLKKAAAKHVEDVLKNFVDKQLAKLTSIISKKGNLKEVKLLTGGGVEFVVLLCTFDDGSEFTVRNQIVWVYNEKGTQFTRFPTTFHHIVFADGSKKQGASEEWMNSKFI